MTREDLLKRQREAERRAVLAELDAIDAALDVLEHQLGHDDDFIADTRRRAQAQRVRWAGDPAVTLH